MERVKEIRLKPAIGSWYEYRPVKVSRADFVFENLEKNQVDEVLEMHYKFGSKVMDVFNNSLMTATELHETIMVQQKYSDFLSEHTGQYITVIGTTNTGVDIHLFFDYGLAFSLINRATGGKGERKRKGEELTALEKIIIKPIVEKLVNVYEEVWFSSFKVVVSDEYNAPKVRIDEKIKKELDVVSIKTMMTIADQEVSGFEVMMTSGSLEKLYETYNIMKQRKPKRTTVYLSPDSINNVKIPVSVKIGTTTVTMNDILSLKAGDIFQLNEKLSDSIYFSVDKDTDFYGILGTKKGKYAIKIIERKPKFFEIPGMGGNAGEMLESSVEAPISLPKSVIKEARPKQEKKIQEPIVVNEAQLSKGEKVDAEEIEIKDTLLEEFDNKEENETEESEEFSWDLDDLK